MCSRERATGSPPAPSRRREGEVRFAGYAAVFGRPDKGGDVIRAGAFAEALRRAGEVPLVWQHKAGAVVGRIEHLSEDKRGLRVIAAVEDARAARLVGGGKINGLSFGYRVREASAAGGKRELIALDLVEVSLVANPMQPRARVHAVQAGLRSQT
ncbi:HK97 family phage prohead protease [Sphingomonas lutea]|uniref:HK97 family phage prohead protease n=1 Tax=Sphingomonas lutea TaxID=1045317 RepID=A0A7G9SLA9_9SPHN|nr:HK97 family phage prohead protease [Sphingomonas lutea]